MQLHQSPTKARAALALLLITYAQGGEAAAATKGENRQAFGLLCNVVLAAKNLQGKQQPSPAAADAALTAKHIDLILTEPSAIAKMAATPTATENQAPTDSEIPEKCQGSLKEHCQQAANYLKNLSPEEKKKLELATSPASPLHTQITKTVKLMTDLGRLAQRYLTGGEATKAIKTALDAAIYGSSGNAKDLKLSGAGADRETHCGKANTAGSSSKNSIAETLTCLCASDSTSTGTKACYTAGAAQQQFDQQGRGLTVWSEIEGKCSSEGNHNRGDPLPNIAATAAEIRRMLHQPKGNGGAIGYLGHVGTGAAAAGCDGADTGGTGPCVAFVSAANTIQEPAWLSALDKAAEKQQELKDEQATALKAEIQLTSLNESLTNLLQLNAMAIQQQSQKATGAAVAAENNKQNQEAAEKDCNKKEKESECKATPKCAWNTDEKDETKKCTLSEEGKKAAEKVNQETGGKDGKTTTNTTGSNSFLIHKAPLLLAFLLF